MRAKNDVVALRLTTMGNRGSKNQLPRALVAASPKRQVPGTDPLRSGALGEIRTPDPRIRSPMLYPAELRAQFRTPRISDLFGQFYGGANGNVQGTVPEGRVLLLVLEAEPGIFLAYRDA